MAEKKKSHRAKKKSVLLPEVPDVPTMPAGEETASEEKRRADQTVDQLIESLFGEKKKRGSVPVSVLEKVEAADVQDAPIHSEEASVVAESTDELGEEVFSLEPIAAPEISFKEEIEASPADFRLLLDMEYEQELGEAIGFERIRAYHEKNMNGRKISRPTGAREKEFESQSQDTEVRRRYVRERTGWIVRLVLSLCLLGVMLLYENAALMARLFDGPLDGGRYPVPYILIGLQILLLDAAICYRSLREGVVQLLHSSPVAYSVHTVILLVSVLYHVVILFLPIRQYPMLFLSPAALSVSLLALGKLLDLYREGFAFDVVSARRQKYAILPRVCVGGEQSSARARLEKNDHNGNVWYLRPVGFVRNYFANTDMRGWNERNLGAHLLLVIAFGMVFALFSFAGGKILSQVVAVFFIAVMLCAPVISLLLTSLPLFFSARFCLRGRGAIIGEAALEQCGGKDTIVLPDTDLFATIEHEHFHLVDLCDAHRVTVLARALLEKVQSPLATAFGVDAASRIATSELTLTHIAAGGVIAGLRESDTTVAIGTVSYMLQRGYTLPAAERERVEDIHRLLIAVDGKVCAAFCVRYTPVADLGALLSALTRDGVRVMVRSKDPCIREEIFAELFPRLSYAIAVQKPSVDEMELRTDRMDSGVVSLGSCKELARTYLICRRVRRARRWGKCVQLLAVMAGGVLTALSMWGDYQVLPGWITLWMLFWCVIYGFVSYFYLRRPTDDI